MKTTAALVLWCSCSMLFAQQKVRILEPDRVQELSKLAASDPDQQQFRRPTGFAYRNTSQKTVVSLSIQYSYADGTELHDCVNGLDAPWYGVKPGEVIGADLGYIIAGTFRLASPPDVRDKQLVSISIDWLLFDDGTFYGDEVYRERLIHKADTAQKLFEEMTSSPDEEAVAARYEACSQDLECLRKSGRSKADWTVIRRALNAYRAHRFAYRRNQDKVLTMFLRIYQTFPRPREARAASSAAASKIAPKDQDDGWVLASLSGTCNGSGLPLSQDPYGVSGLTAPGLGSKCNYSTPAYKLPPYSLGDDPHQQGFISNYEAACFNVDHGVDGVLKSGLILDAYSPVSQYSWEATALLFPRHYAFSQLSTDANALWPQGDMVTWGVMYEYSEPFNPQSTAYLGGTTTCTYVDPSCAGGGPNCWAQDPSGITILTDANTKANFWTGNDPGGRNMNEDDPGFPISNFLVGKGCNGLVISEPYVGLPVFILFPDAGAFTDCIWQSPPAQEAGGDPPPPACDQTSDCCCCLANPHGDAISCALVCRNVPRPNCGIVAVVQPDGSVANVTFGEGATFNAYTDTVSTPGVFETATVTVMDGSGNSICNTGYALDGGICSLVAPCPNPNVIPDAYGNCEMPGFGCIWVGYQQQDCGGAFSSCPYGLITQPDGSVWTNGPFVGFSDSGMACYATDCGYDTTCGSTYAWTPLPGCDPLNPNYCVGPGTCPDHTLPQNDPYGVCDDCSGCIFCDSSGNCQAIPSGCYVQNYELICPNLCQGDTVYDNGSCVCPSSSGWSTPDQYGNCNPPPDGCIWCGPNDQCCDQ